MIGKRAKSHFKSALLASRIHLLLKPFRGLMRFLVYFSEMVEWSLAAGRENRAALFDQRTDLYEYIHTKRIAGRAIDYLEFGVWTGASFRWWLKNNDHPSSRFIGFDTFTGLPEAWGYYEKHHFDTSKKVPEVNDPRASFQVGLFQDTLADYLARNERRAPLVVNIDADLYSSTLFVLTTLAPVLRSGDIVIFDEFLAWRTPTDQFRAFIDFAGSFYFDYRFVGAATHFEELAVEIVAGSKEGGRGRRVR